LRIFHAAQELGEVDLLRVYGDAGRLTGWEDTAGFRLIHSGTGKNAADLLLTVDAMERALSGACDAVVIASSDGDFRHLAERLRERGLTVLGMGQEKAGLRFKASCCRFVSLRPVGLCGVDPAVPARSDPPVVAPETDMSAAGPAGLVAQLTKKIIETIRTDGCPTKGLALTELQQLMFRQHRVAISHYPEKTWRNYLQARPQHFSLDPKGPNARVRLKPSLQIAAE
jgi:hypothetical protein